MDYFISEISEEQLRKERAKAREIRNSQWWKRRLSEGVCHYCGKPFSPKELTMDHIVPLIRGGKSSKGNVVPCCKDCNNKKKHMLPIEWNEFLERLRGEEDD
jgi:5-methylcytosine-specific restriction endonuclease McrA